MVTALSALLVLSISLVSVFTLFAVPGSISEYLNRKNIVKPQGTDAIAYLNIAFAILNFIGFNFALYFGSPRTVFRIIAFLGVFGLIYLVYMSKSLVARFSYMYVFLGIALWLVLPNILFGRTSGLLLNMVTHGNNDIANYAASSQYYLDNGFREVDTINAYSWNDFNLNSAYQSPNNLLAFISSISNLETWQITTPALLIAIAIGMLSISRLIVVIWNEKNHFLSIGVPFAIFSTGLMVYVEGNFFLGQIIAISLSISIISNLISFYKNKFISLLLLTEMGSLVYLSIFTYPHFLLPLYLFSFLVIFCIAVYKYKNKIKLKTYVLILTGLISLFLSINYLRIALKLALAQNNVVAGWPIPQLNPISMLFFPDLIGLKIDSGTQILAWGSLFAFLGVLILKYGTFSNKHLYLIANLLVPVMIVTIVHLRGRGFDDYGSWKLQSYVLPIYLSLFLPLILKLFNKNRTYVIIFILGVLIPSPLSNWSYGGAINGFYVNHDLVKVSEMEELKSLKDLNIDLVPYFETMSAGNVIEGPILHINSLSYWPKSINANACFLVNWPAKNEYKYVRQLNASYALAANSLQTCPEAKKN